MSPLPASYAGNTALGTCGVDTEWDKRARSADRHELRASAGLAAVREELAEVEALEDEVRHRGAHLRTVLPPAQFRLVWALLDAQERLGLAERLLAEHATADVR